MRCLTKIFRKSDKKGQMGTIGTLIIILVSAIVLFFIITQFTKTLDLNKSMNLCRLSVLGQVATEVKPSTSGWESPINLQCKSRYVDFHNTEVDIGLDPSYKEPVDVNYNGHNVNKFNALNDFIVNQVIAEEMRICYKQFGEGKIDVFPNNEKNSDRDVCFICSQISFKGMSPRNFVGLKDYINKTYIANEQMTYEQYFDSGANNSLYSWSEIAKYYPNSYWTIDSTKPYVVIFKKNYEKLDLGNVFSPTAILSGFQNTYTVHVMQSSELNNWCSVIAN